MSTIFEKTMAACLENKRVKSTNTMVQGVKKRATLKEQVDLDLDDTDNLGDSEETMGDIEDDVMVVIDPEKDPEEGTDDLNQIVDDTPEGETAKTEEYIGDKTYACPICGNTFFSETDMQDGDECPVCGDYPTKFVLAGKVAEADAEGTDDDTDDIDVEDDMPDEELAPADDMEDEELESFTRVKPMVKKMEERKAPKKVPVSYSLDENTFNPILTRFVRENFKNARSLFVVGAKMNGSKLALECQLTFKSGNKKTVTLVSEGTHTKTSVKECFSKVTPSDNVSISMNESGTAVFKKAPTDQFSFRVKLENRVIKCESVTYNLGSKKLKEGKTVAEVCGTVSKAKEGKKPAKKMDPKADKKQPAAKK